MCQLRWEGGALSHHLPQREAHHRRGGVLREPHAAGGGEQLDFDTNSEESESTHAYKGIPTVAVFMTRTGIPPSCDCVTPSLVYQHVKDTVQELVVPCSSVCDDSSILARIINTCILILKLKLVTSDIFLTIIYIVFVIVEFRSQLHVHFGAELNRAILHLIVSGILANTAFMIMTFEF